MSRKPAEEKEELGETIKTILEEAKPKSKELTTREEIFKELRKDKELWSFIAPVPDYQMAMLVLLKRIERKLDK